MSQQRTRVECPQWHSPLFHILPDAVECRCRSCRGIHTISRADLEAAWQKLQTLQDSHAAHIVQQAS